MIFMDYVQVATQSLERDIDEMESCLKRVSGQMKAMVTGMEELNRMWKGPANRVFRKRFAEDCEKVNEVQELMAVYLAGLKDAGSEYCKCENKVSDIIRAVRI